MDFISIFVCFPKENWEMIKSALRVTANILNLLVVWFPFGIFLLASPSKGCLGARMRRAWVPQFSSPMQPCAWWMLRRFL